LEYLNAQERNRRSIAGSIELDSIEKERIVGKLAPHRF
jgi:hypothetical protein